MTRSIGCLLALALLLPAACTAEEADPPDTQPAVGGDAGATNTARAPLDYDAHVTALREKVPDGFTIVVQKPFVVVGDESAATVKRRARRTVGWAVRRLKEGFFEKDPDHVITVWLFKDKASYEKHLKELFGRKPHTPFGFYSSREKALIMNIATGGGTLVHEIVHPFVAANFPECPPWLNEGLGSLYEQCADRGGKIVGLTNWRLKGLQKAIREKRTLPLEKLCGLDEAGFYGTGSGLHYAQARYLCYWLQQRGKLRRFYRAFHAARAGDPTGYATLETTIGTDDMAAFQKDWETSVLKLTFP